MRIGFELQKSTLSTLVSDVTVYRYKVENANDDLLDHLVIGKGDTGNYKLPGQVRLVHVHVLEIKWEMI